MRPTAGKWLSSRVRALPFGRQRRPGSRTRATGLTWKTGNRHDFDHQHATALQAKAASEGLSLEAWLEKLAERDTPPRRHIWEVIAENIKDVPPEDLAALPKDGLGQIDHCIRHT